MGVWVMSMAVLGAIAALLGVGLFWLVLTRPILVAQAFGGF
jgi:hypothetical protein